MCWFDSKGFRQSADPLYTHNTLVDKYLRIEMRHRRLLGEGISGSLIPYPLDISA